MRDRRGAASAGWMDPERMGAESNGHQNRPIRLQALVAL